MNSKKATLSVVSDGSYLIKSLKEIFPERLWDKVITGNNKYPELAKQQEEQAAEQAHQGSQQ